MDKISENILRKFTVKQRGGCDEKIFETKKRQTGKKILKKYIFVVLRVVQSLAGRDSNVLSFNLIIK